MSKPGVMRNLLTSVLVILAFPLVLGTFLFLMALLGTGVVPADQRPGMNALVFNPMVTIKDVSQDSLVESISNATILTESYVVLAWILSGGLALVVGFMLPRFQLVSYLLMSLAAMMHVIVQSVAYELPVWMPVVGVLGLGTLTFLMASLTSRVRIMPEDWLFQNLGQGKSDSDFVISESIEVKKCRTLFSIWNWLFTLCFLGWIVYVVTESSSQG